jgi:hypothetical protein
MHSLPSPHVHLFSRQSRSCSFIAVDNHLSKSECEAIFMAHEDQFDGANSLVPLLCVLPEAKFEIPVHELGWFTNDTKRVVAKCKWDNAKDRVVLIHPEDGNNDPGFNNNDECMKSVCDIFYVDSKRDGNGFKFDMEPAIEDCIRPKNQRGDEVKRF